MVAKSFQSWEILCEPYSKSNRLYVRVLNPKNQKEREVRWYSEKEYSRMYGEIVVSQKNTDIPEKYWSPATQTYHNNDPYYKTQKELLGFSNGYITIFKGDSFAYKDYLKSIGCKYNKFWKWGLSSDVEVPTDLPSGLTPIKLEWSAVGDDTTEKLKSDSEIETAVDALIYEESPSEFIGTPGERLEFDLTVIKVNEFENYFSGTSYMHIMEDIAKNVFIWNTGARKLEEGVTYHIKGTIKEHKVYRNVKQTILTRCSAIEEE